MITKFIIQKTEKKNEKAPDRRIRAKVGDEWVEIGAGWVRNDKNGNPYISCVLANPYKDKKGYEINEQNTPVSPQEALGREF